MKEKLNELVEKAKANKQVLIRVGVAAVAAVGVGVGVGLAIHLKNQNDNPLFDEDFSDLEDEQRSEDEDGEETAE